jgi:hypothetical protein
LNLVKFWVRHLGLGFYRIRSGFCLIVLCEVMVSVFELWLIVGRFFFRGSFFGLAINNFKF